MENKDLQTENEVSVKTNTQPVLTKKEELINLIKFVLFSISAGVIQIASFTILSELIFHDANNDYGISYFISLALSVLWNFTFNRKFTFKSANNVPIAMLLVLAYYCVFTPLSIWWGIALTNIGWNEYIVLFITMVINMLTEFLWTRYVVYRNSINSAVKPKEDEKTKEEKVETVKEPKEEVETVKEEKSAKKVSSKSNKTKIAKTKKQTK
ncbi:MAG: GtrA family protein [Clostridiales bacterium]|nr:GtrA family protein [Candidatus Apopatousia equi]